MNAVRLDAASVEAVAERVVEMLQSQVAAPEQLVDAAEIARRFGVARDTVYAKADEWGASRIGSGPRARLRFDPARVADALAAGRGVTDGNASQTRPRRRRPRTSNVELLPVAEKEVPMTDRRDTPLQGGGGSTPESRATDTGPPPEKCPRIAAARKTRGRR